MHGRNETCFGGLAVSMTSPPDAPPPSYALRISALTTLYFAQGLPFGFFALAVPVLLRRSGTPLALIGLSSLLALPWGLKFLWAPSVERHFSRRVGRRKSWIWPMQICTAAALAVTGLVPHTTQRPLLVAFFVVSFFSATQDIATDGLALDLLSPRERAAANGIQVGAYRAGMIAGGGGILFLFSAIGIREAFFLMSGLVLASSLPLLFLKEPAPPTPAPVRGVRATLGPVVSFFRRDDAVRILGLVALFKLGEALAAGMMKPFFVDSGFSDGEISFSRGLVGGVSAIAGAAASGATLNRLGRRRGLALFGALQAVPCALYALAALLHPSHAVFVVLVVIEQASFAAATTALFTRMMDFVRDEHRASDYTVLACGVVAVTGVGMATSGFIAHGLGFAAHFGLAALLALAAPIAVLVLDRGPTASRAADS